MSQTLSRILGAAWLWLLACCSTGVDPSAPEDVVPPTDAAAESGTGANPDTALPLNGCARSDFVDRSGQRDPRVIEIATLGLTFTPKCMRIAPGQRVRFEGNLAAHPLAPGNPEDRSAGSAGSPVEATSSGNGVDFEFPDRGVFPYHCTLHSFGPGRGMAGAILVE